MTELRAARALFARLRLAHPDAHCELVHEDPFQLLVATVLSAQSTDRVVNSVTPALFADFPDARTMARAERSELEAKLNRLGMFRQKARAISELSSQLVARHGGRVPEELSALVELRGVGRKTANVVLGVAFGRPEGVVVDTHVARLAQRLGFSQATDPASIEADLMHLFPRKDWDILSHTLIFHGRRVCLAARPRCGDCPVASSCPSAHHAEQIGRRQRPPRLSSVRRPKAQRRERTSGRT